MGDFKRIVVHPDLPQGYPTIRDTGVSVFEIGRRGARGETLDMMVAAHPALEVADIEEALDFCQQDMKRMVSEAVFDSKKPVHIMLGYASLLQEDGLDAAETHDFGRQIPPYVRSIDEVWSGLSALMNMKYREHPTATERRPARAVIDQAVGLCHGQATMDIRVKLPKSLPDIAAGDILVQALYGLFSSRGDSCLEAEAVVHAAVKGNQVRIKIQRPSSARQHESHFQYILNQHFGRLAAAVYALHTLKMPLKVDVRQGVVVFRVDVPVWDEREQEKA